jgi:[acyl-carrier-protein] S-malonyltransferase
MGRLAYDKLPLVRDLFDRSAQCLGYDLAQLCFEGPAEELDSTVRSQPALFVCGLAALEMLRVENAAVVRQCEAAAGLSLGEYTALVFAEVLEFEPALEVVKVRGEAMQQASDAVAGAMVSVLGMESEEVERVCDEARREGEILQLANYLCPGNVAISGHRVACQRAGERAQEMGAMRSIPLAVAGAFHTPLMQEAVRPLADALAQVTLARPRLPVVSNVDAQPHDEPEQIRELLIQQVVSPVLWEASMRYLLEQEFRSFYEVGPGRVLRGLLKRIDRQAKCEGVAV